MLLFGSFQSCCVCVYTAYYAACFAVAPVSFKPEQSKKHLFHKPKSTYYQGTPQARQRGDDEAEVFHTLAESDSRDK